jgi:hypothetical protein
LVIEPAIEKLVQYFKTGEDFLSIKLELPGEGAKMVITDGDENVLYTQDYDYTSAKKELQLFYQSGGEMDSGKVYHVLMLSGEY